MMRRALAVLAIVSAMAASAAVAEPRHSGGGWGGGGWGHGHHSHGWSRPWYRPDAGTAFWGGVIGGTLGSLLRPGQAESSLRPWSSDWYAYCSGRYRSFNPQTGQFFGYDGNYHFCGD